MIVLQYDNTKQQADVVIKNKQLLIDDGLETAAIISLFTERRLESDDEDPNATYHGGCWTDSFTGDKIGSRLWKLRNKVATESNLGLAKAYITEALQWMLDDGVASKIVVTTAKGKTLHHMKFQVDIYRPGQNSAWSRIWEKRFNEL